jgi:hypothetical protein
MILRALIIVTILLTVLAAALVAAVAYLPWWGALLTLAGSAGALWLAVRLLSGRVLGLLFSVPFRAKGAVLRRAEAEVHSVAPAEAPGDGGSGGEGDADGPLDRFSVDVTVRPRPTAGPFHHWEPGELAVVPAAARVEPFGDAPAGARVLGVEVFDGGRFGPDEGMKYFGPQRLRLLVGVPPGGDRRLAFLYYFEKFGTLTLPAPGARAETGPGSPPAGPESTRR